MASPYGGFDCDFVITPPERLRCAICRHVLRDPQLTTCGHHFCMSCITNAYQESQVCPVCQTTYTIFRDQRFLREVRELQVRCSNKIFGCQWVGKLGNYIDEHTDHCEFVKISCRNCQQSVPRGLMVKHQEFFCPHRKYGCDHCQNYVSTYTDVAENYWPICNFFPVPCPNDCRERSIPRSRLMEHIRSECKVKKQISELQEKLRHLEEQAAEASLQKSSLLDQIQHLEEKLNERDTIVKELEEQVANLQSRMEELQKDHSNGGHHGPVSQQSNGVNLRDRSASEPDTGRKIQEEDRDPLVQSLPNATPLPELSSSPCEGLVPRLPLTKVNLLQDSNVRLEWSSCEDLPETMVDGYAVLLGDFVYVGGGICKSEDAVYKYSYKNNNWSTLPKANRQKFAMVSYKNQLILIGGRDLNADYVGSLLVWDEELHMWTDNLYTSTMNTARMLAAACSYEERIIVAGGKNGRFSTLDSVEVFDGKEWHDVAQLPGKIYSAKTAVFEKQLFIMGGEGQRKAVYCASLDSLIENMHGWTSISDTEFPYASIAAFGNTLLAIGGSTGMGSTSAVRAYFTGTKTWLRVGLSLPRTFCCTAVVVISPEELLVIGGCSGRTKYRHVFKGMLKYSS